MGFSPYLFRGITAAFRMLLFIFPAEETEFSVYLGFSSEPGLFVPCGDRSPCGFLYLVLPEGGSHSAADIGSRRSPFTFSLSPEERWLRGSNVLRSISRIGFSAALDRSRAFEALQVAVHLF